MLQKTKKAVVTTVKVSHIEFEGLMLPNGGYAIAVSQLYALGLIRQNKASKDLKALLGNSFKFKKTIYELNPRAVNIISLSDFKKLLIKLDRKGNKPAQDLRDELELMDLSFKQVFSEAFRQKVEKDENLQWLKERQDGKYMRRTFTDSIKDYIENNPQLSNNDKTWIYSNASDTLNKLMFGRTAKQLCKSYQCKKGQLRDQFERKDIIGIRRLEEYAMNLVDRQNFHPVQAVKEAFSFWDGARV